MHRGLVLMVEPVRSTSGRWAVNGDVDLTLYANLPAPVVQ